MRVQKLESTLKGIELLLESIVKEAQEQRDRWEGKADSWKESDRGEKEVDAIEEIQSAIEEIEIAAEKLSNLIDQNRNA